jgi:hypothetical protein
MVCRTPSEAKRPVSESREVTNTMAAPAVSIAGITVVIHRGCETAPFR